MTPSSTTARIWQLMLLGKVIAVAGCAGEVVSGRDGAELEDALVVGPDVLQCQVIEEVRLAAHQLHEAVDASSVAVDALAMTVYAA